VITGLGAVSAWGWGVGALREGLGSRQTGIRPFTRFDHRRQRTHVAGEVPGEPGPGFPRGPGWNRLSYADRFALFAAREAVDQARAPLEGPAAGVYFGSSTGGMLESERYFARLLAGVRHPARTDMASQQINGPGDAVARALGVTGPVSTLSSACASGALAIGAALDALRAGEVDVALAGGSDSLCQITYSGFNALRAVDEVPCRPFREGRAGMSIGEGAAVLILERLHDARARGARPLAELCGAGASCDAGHMTAPDPEGAGAAAAIERALADASLPPVAIDFVNAHGTGTPLNDVAEFAALRRVFGERAAALPVTSTKGAVGHLLGSSGALEAVVTVLGLVDQEVHATPGGGRIDPAIPVRLALDVPLAVPHARTALSTSLAFGGANAALVLGRWAA
jgi:3-oxoacyl-[acyl-carrier-protein] synthase II